MKLLIPLRFCLWALVALPGRAHAWTDANLTDVRVAVDLARSGQSTVETVARFEVQGGKFHGFDLAPMDGGALIQEECSAKLDDGRRFLLTFCPIKDGRTRVLLAGDEAIRQSGITFTLIHRVDLAAAGALRSHAGRARLDWTPLIWDESCDRMTVEIALPEQSKDAPIAADQAVSANYAVEAGADRISFVKHRAVRWYPMQVAIDFDPAIVSALREPTPVDAAPTVDTERGIGTAAIERTAPFHVAVMPAFALFFGIVFLARKSWVTARALRDLGIAPRHRLLPRTGWLVRTALAVLAGALALAVQRYGSLAAAVPALAAAAALWSMRREESSTRPRLGGEWRPMSDEELHAFTRLVRAYRARRRSLLDITSPAGVATFLLFLAAVGYAVVVTRESWPEVAFATVVNALVTAVPAWFANVRSELPVDPTIEGFGCLRRWRAALARMVGARSPGAKAEFWARTDEKGVVEVRLRVDRALEGVRSIEVAGEVVKAGATLRCRKAVVLRLTPGTEAARRLAGCPYAAEHHLTADFQEEIIVLRNRRGNTDKGLAPLRAVLALLAGQPRSA